MTQRRPGPQPRRDGVCVGLTRDGRMLLVRTHRHPSMWQPVGGGLEAGEQPADAAIREVREETRWPRTPAALREVTREAMDAHAGELTFYLAAAPIDTEPVLDPTEIAEHRWVTPHEAVTLPAFDAARRFYARWANTRRQLHTGGNVTGSYPRPQRRLPAADHNAGATPRAARSAANDTRPDASRALRTPVGTLYLRASAAGLTAVTFTPSDAAPAAGTTDPVALAHVDAACDQLGAYFAGRLSTFTVPLAPEPDHKQFTRAVLAVIGRIPYGETRTYADIAAESGNPKATRAVGTACARNRLVVVRPCHRVIPTRGGVGDYAGGPAVKRALLDLETGRPTA